MPGYIDYAYKDNHPIPTFVPLSGIVPIKISYKIETFLNDIRLVI